MTTTKQVILEIPIVVYYDANQQQACAIQSGLCKFLSLSSFRPTCWYTNESVIRSGAINCSHLRPSANCPLKELV